MTIPQLACLALISFLFGQIDPSAAVCQYRIKTRTGSQPFAATQAIASVKLYGNAANCGWKQLNTNGATLSGSNYFSITCPCLGCLVRLRMRHNNAGVGPAWYLKYVGVRRLPSPSSYQKFTCNKWLSSATHLSRLFTKSKTPYRIRIYTGFQSSAGTNAQVKIRLKSNTIWSPQMTLNGGFPSSSTRTFYRRIVNSCPVKKVYIRHNNAGSRPAWYLRKVYVYNRAMKINYRCVCNGWMFSPNLSKTLTCQKI